MLLAPLPKLKDPAEEEDVPVVPNGTEEYTVVVFDAPNAKIPLLLLVPNPLVVVAEKDKKTLCSMILLSAKCTPNTIYDVSIIEATW